MIGRVYKKLQQDLTSSVHDQLSITKKLIKIIQKDLQNNIQES